MQRTRVDGNKFQQELVTAAEHAAVPAYVVRLHTPQARQSNVRNIADFIVFSERTVILEVKETGDVRFSLNTFQQADKVKEFQPVFEKLKKAYNWESPKQYPYRLAILVHFIKCRVFTLYYLDENGFVVLHPTDPQSEALKHFSSIEDACNEILRIQ